MLLTRNVNNKTKPTMLQNCSSARLLQRSKFNIRPLRSTTGPTNRLPDKTSTPANRLEFTMQFSMWSVLAATLLVGSGLAQNKIRISKTTLWP